MRIEVISLGTELLCGNLNSDLSYIGRRLKSIGFSLNRETTVPDNLKEVIEVFKEAEKRSDLLILIGGLGPTFDDLTREAAAKALKRKLVFKPSLLIPMEEHFKKQNVPMPPINRVQANIIEGAVSLPNPVGTAPGMLIEDKGKTIILLPGPLSELQPIFENSVLPYLKKRFQGERKEVISFRIAGKRESEVAELFEKSRLKYEKKGLKFTILAHPYLIEIRAEGEKKEILSFKKEAKKLFGKEFTEEESLEKLVGKFLLRQNLTLGLAESCTGGLLGNLITKVPGSSRYFYGSIVSYSNLVKKKILKVPRTTLKKFGAVSPEVALKMAKGVRKATKSKIGLSITGIAGPGGGTEAKPVGLVFIGLSTKIDNIVKEFHFKGSRETVKERASLAALNLLREHLTH